MLGKLRSAVLGWIVRRYAGEFLEEMIPLAAVDGLVSRIKTFRGGAIDRYLDEFIDETVAIWKRTLRSDDRKG